MLPASGSVVRFSLVLALVGALDTRTTLAVEPTPAASAAPVRVGLEADLPELRFRNEKYVILEEVQELARTSNDEQLKEWSRKALLAPFFQRDVFRMRFVHQRILNELLAVAAPGGLEGLQVWMGGQDFDTRMGRFPWSTLTVSVLAAGGNATPKSKEVAEKLQQLLEPAKDLPGHVTYVQNPHALGVTVGPKELADPTYWMTACRSIYENSGGAKIPEDEWKRWVTIFTQRARYDERAVVDYSYPEAREPLREAAHDALFQSGWKDPSVWARIHAAMAPLQAAYFARGQDIPAFREKVTAWTLDHAAEKDEAYRKLYISVGSWYARLADEEERRQKVAKLQPAADGSFRSILDELLKIYPEPFYDKHNLAAFRDHPLHELARKHAVKPTDLVMVDGLFSIEGFREYRSLVDELSARLAKATGDEGKKMRDELRTTGSRMAILALTAEVTAVAKEPAAQLESLGFVPFKSLRQMVSFVTVPGYRDDARSLFTVEARGKVLQMFLESRFRDGLFIQSHDAIDEDLPYLEKELGHLLGGDFVHEYYLLAREFVRWTPHTSEQDLLNEAKALSLIIDKARKDFYAIRQNIHNHTSPRDVDETRQFLEKLGKESRRDEAVIRDTERLLAVLEDIFSTENASQAVREALERVKDAALVTEVTQLMAKGSAATAPELALFFSFRAGLRDRVENKATTGPDRLALIDLDLALARAMIPWIGGWLEATQKAGTAPEAAWFRMLADGLYADGLLASYEREALAAVSTTPGDADLGRLLQRVPEWALGAARLVFGREMMASTRVLPDGSLGFLDNLVRSSTLLPYDRLLTERVKEEEKAKGIEHQIAAEKFFSGIRGLNPGSARGVLEILDEHQLAGHVEYVKERIYMLPRGTSELGAVSGVITQEEGSAISHVQLLARNLGIPNATISPQAFQAAKPLAGQTVLYVVLPDGSVYVGPEDGASDKVKQFVASREVKTEKVTLPPVDEKADTILTLEDIGMVDSGKKAGPKAANVGELRHTTLKDRVPQGVVLPFGLYGRYVRAAGIPERITAWVQDPAVRADMVKLRAALEKTRAEIEAVPLDDAFLTELEKKMEALPGTTGFFVRSDTNVEDLPFFTGAGLNKTVPNVRGRESLVNAIHAVWASPWTERSFRWREDLIGNLDYVFPSVLIMRSQNAAKAGVMITRDIDTGDSGRVYISAHEGLGIKVVDGSETPHEVVYEPATKKIVNLRFAKAREKLVLEGEGGVVSKPRSPDGRVVTPADIEELARVGFQIREDFAKHHKADWDIEWLILESGQVIIVQSRPFVEKSATSAAH